MAKVSVRIEDRQKEWLDEHHINKSALFRDLLDNYISDTVTCEEANR